jgi:hypothetical protein
MKVTLFITLKRVENRELGVSSRCEIGASEYIQSFCSKPNYCKMVIGFGFSIIERQEEKFIS